LKLPENSLLCDAGFRSAGVSPAFLRGFEIRKIAGDTPALRHSYVIR
jgi:hypothetical protein